MRFLALNFWLFPRSCRKNRLFFAKQQTFSRISLEVRDFFVPLPSRNIQERLAPWAVKDARVITQGIFYAHTSEVCQRPHYTNSGGHPVDISPRTEVLNVSRQGGLPLSLSIGENIPSKGTIYSQRGNNSFPVREQNRAGRIPVCETFKHYATVNIAVRRLCTDRAGQDAGHGETVPSC